MRERMREKCAYRYAVLIWGVIGVPHERNHCSMKACSLLLQIKRMKWDESSFKVPNMITYDEGISFSIPKHSTRNFNITSNLYWHPNVVKKFAKK